MPQMRRDLRERGKATDPAGEDTISSDRNVSDLSVRRKKRLQRQSKELQSGALSAILLSEFYMTRQVLKCIRIMLSA
jgi:hypothetical protein